MGEEDKIDDSNFRKRIASCMLKLDVDPKACNEMKHWDISRVTDCSELFKEHGPGTVFPATELFNVDISGWNTSGCTSMWHMFQSAKSFNRPVGKWDVSNVDNMNAVFESAASFDQDLSKWQTSKVTDMKMMFAYAAKFNNGRSKKLPWDVSKVKSFDYTFQDTRFNRDISAWDVSSAKYFSGMFSGATAFKQTLCWNVDQSQIEKLTADNQGVTVDADIEACLARSSGNAVVVAMILVTVLGVLFTCCLFLRKWIKERQYREAKDRFMNCINAKNDQVNIMFQNNEDDIDLHCGKEIFMDSCSWDIKEEYFDDELTHDGKTEDDDSDDTETVKVTYETVLRKSRDAMVAEAERVLEKADVAHRRSSERSVRSTRSARSARSSGSGRSSKSRYGFSARKTQDVLSSLERRHAELMPTDLMRNRDELPKLPAMTWSHDESFRYKGKKDTDVDLNDSDDEENLSSAVWL